MLHLQNKQTYFYVTATLRTIESEEFWKVQTPDVLLKRYLFLIGGYSEMLFSEAREEPCAYVKDKKNKNAIHIFNMVDISVNPIREKNFWLPQKNHFQKRLRKELKPGNIVYKCWRFDSETGGNIRRNCELVRNLPPLIVSPGCCIHLYA